MEWLTFNEALARKLTIRGSPPQYLEFPADLTGLAVEIPTRPEFQDAGAIAGPSYQWYARVGDRPLIIEREKEIQDKNERIFVHTSYLQCQDRFGDWSVLLELSDLPKSIYTMRPNFVLSRNLTPSWVVFRPNPAGWSSVIYNASSRLDAEELLKFLKKDRFNEGCFIGPPEPEGLWSAIQTDEGHETVLCTYPTRSGALSVACNLSMKTPASLLLVKDRSHANPQQYFISGGRILNSTSS